MNGIIGQCISFMRNQLFSLAPSLLSHSLRDIFKFFTQFLKHLIRSQLDHKVEVVEVGSVSYVLRLYLICAQALVYTPAFLSHFGKMAHRSSR